MNVITKSTPVYINDLIVAVGANKQRVTVGKYTVPRLVFADVFVGISEHLKECRNR